MIGCVFKAWFSIGHTVAADGATCGGGGDRSVENMVFLGKRFLKILVNAIWGAAPFVRAPAIVPDSEPEFRWMDAA